MKLFTLGFLCLLLSCCIVEVEPRPVPDTSGVTVYYTPDYCAQDPYEWEPEWCDWHDDNTICCVWLVDGWYEEWCQWQGDWCWDFLGEW
jgi:hypothetical protein